MHTDVEPGSWATEHDGPSVVLQERRWYTAGKHAKTGVFIPGTSFSSQGHGWGLDAAFVFSNGEQQMQQRAYGYREE